MTSVVVNDLSNLYATLAGQFMWLIRVILEAAVAIVVSLWISWQLSLIYFIVLPASVFLFRRISRPSLKQRKQVSDSTGDAMQIADCWKRKQQ